MILGVELPELQVLEALSIITSTYKSVTFSLKTIKTIEYD